MKTTVSKSEFVKAFDDYNRSDNFSRAGLEALYDYFEGYEESTGEEIELDVIAICCEYSEYENIKEFQDNYGDEYETIEDIENNTTCINIDDESFIIQDF